MFSTPPLKSLAGIAPTSNRLQPTKDRRAGAWALLALTVALALPFAPRDAEALPVLRVTVQPIQVCNDAGGDCANSAMNLFLAETDKIWAPADIDIDFLSFMTVNSSAQLNEDNFGDLGLNADPSIVNMWFVEDLSECGGPADPTALFGCGSSAGRVAITDLVFAFAGGIGRLDTIAHELGHVLGLGHFDFGAGAANNLMTQGSDRTIPTTIDDIFPDGLDLDQLTAAQITEARSSDFAEAVLPEPGTILLLALGLLALAGHRARRMRPSRGAA